MPAPHSADLLLNDSFFSKVMNREARRLEKEIKDTLEDFSQDPAVKEKLLTGRRVMLAEEMSKSIFKVDK